MDGDGATSKPETLGEVIDQIERMRDELLAIQTVLEKMEVAKRFAEQDAPDGSKRKKGDRQL
jgi:predicted  nucleic acid-binding Zn-ribbon protein